MFAQQTKLAALLACAITAACTAVNSAPLRGQVEINEGPVRLTRQAPKADVVSPAAFSGAAQSTQLTGSTEASDFASAPLQKQTPKAAALPAPLAGQASTISGGVSQTKPQPKEPPYIWWQSLYGGYYDGSGTLSSNNVIPADQLYKYGGKFSDGTPVPRTPISSKNIAGHAFKQGSLTSNIFRSR